MATKTTEVTFDSNAGTSKYDWDNWFDGDVWILTAGEDFDCRIDSMQTAAHIRAGRRGIKVQTKRINKNQLAIKASK